MSKVLVVGWDGATWEIADPLCEAGRLPTLASLREGGAGGVLESVPNMNSAPAWSTIATGLNPGRHGIFYFDEPVPGTRRRAIINAERRSGATLWQMASAAGMRVVVVNVPISYPAQQVNGVLVAGLDTPSKSLPGFTYPTDLPRRHPKLFEGYVIEPPAKSLMQAGKRGQAIDELMRCVDGWASAMEWLMREGEWDLAFVVFTSSDTAQHFFWTDADRHVIERVYELQDQATGRLIRVASERDPDVNVMVIADHGGAANTRGPEFMPIWLQDQGLQAWKRGSPWARTMASGFRLLDRTLTRERKQALALRFPGLRQRAQAAADLQGIDWTATRAYSDGLRDEVLVNLAGRDPGGTVTPEGYSDLVAELTARIGEVEELDTGRAAVESVLAREEAYRGPHLDRAPDVTMRWRTEGPFRGFRCGSPRQTERMREVADIPPFQPGGHHPEGLFAARGPDIRPGVVRGGLADVTPTILALLGAPVPADLDGRPLGILRDTMVQTVEGPAIEAPAASTSGYTPEEEEEIRKRLEALGYL